MSDTVAVDLTETGEVRVVVTGFPGAVRLTMGAAENLLKGLQKALRKPEKQPDVNAQFQRMWGGQAALLEVLQSAGVLGGREVAAILRAVGLTVVKEPTPLRAVYTHNVPLEGGTVMMRPGSRVVEALPGYGSVHVWVDAPAGTPCTEARHIAVVTGRQPVAGRFLCVVGGNAARYLYEVEAP